MKLNGKKVLMSVSVPPRIEPSRYQPTLAATLLALCQYLVRHGAVIVYGGDLRENSFTFDIERAVSALAKVGEKTTLIHVIDQPTFLKVGYEDLMRMFRYRSTSTETNVILGETAAPLASDSEGLRITLPSQGERKITSIDDFAALKKQFTVDNDGAAYTVARTLKTNMADVCIAVGGKTGRLDDDDDRYMGDIPGVAEEAIFTLKHGKPFVPLAAYGGCARELAIALGLLSLKSESVKRHPGFGLAMRQVTDLRSTIPDYLIGQLSRIAEDNDDVQAVGRLTVNVISQWLSAREGSDAF